MDRSTLNKATSSDDVPTPGYLFTEIAKATFDDVNACQQLADYLLKKLERDDPLVKVKVLRIIRHVCDQGKPEFRRAVQKRADLVKACLQYRGKPDPLKGDAPNKAVRDEADTAVKSVFSSDSNTNAYGMAQGAGPKMQGFGSDSADGGAGGGGGYGGSGFGGGGCSGFGSSSNTYGGRGPTSFGSSGPPPPSGGGGMVGFGNPNFDNSVPAEKDSYLKSASTLATGGLKSAGSYLASAASRVPGVSAYVGNISEPPQPDAHTSTYRAPTAAGPGFGGGGGFGSGVQGRWGADAPSQRGAGGGYGGGQGAAPPAAHKDAGEYEARVVSELCAPGGPRVAPSEAALQEFTRKCESLDANCIGDQLRQKLSAPDWQTRLKALCAVESLQQQGLDGIVGHVSQFSSELLFECQEMPQCRQKASKVLQALGFIDQVDQPARAKADPPPAAAAPPVDLLDMDDGPAAPAAAYAAPAGGGVGDLLEGGPSPPASSGYVPPAAAAGGLDMLDLGGDAPPAAPAPAEGGGGLFGSLSMAAPPAPQAAAPVGVGLAPQAPAPAAAGGGLFSSLQLGGSAPEQPPQPAAAPMQSASLGGPEALLQQQLQMTPQQQQQQELERRRAHLNVLSGGAPISPGTGPMATGRRGAGGAMGWPQQPGGCMGGMAMPGGMGMPQQMQPQMQMPMQPQMQHQMQPQMQPQTMGPPFGAMGMPQQPMMAHQPMMQQHMQVPYAGAPTAPAGAGGLLGGPGSAFGFIGGAGGAPQGFPAPAAGMANGTQLDLQPPSAPAADAAFSFVADQMKGANA